MNHAIERPREGSTDGTDRTRPALPARAMARSLRCGVSGTDGLTSVYNWKVVTRRRTPIRPLPVRRAPPAIVNPERPMKVNMFHGSAVLLSMAAALVACTTDPLPPEGEVVALRIVAGDTTLPVGGQVILAAEGLNDQGRAVGSVEVTWTSSDPDVATVDAQGRVRGVSPGTVDVTASSDPLMASLEMTVVELPPLQSGSPDPSRLPQADAQAPVEGFPYGADLNRGQSYVDPLSGVRVWRLTDASLGLGRQAVPSYASGPYQISHPRADGTRHVVLVTDGDHVLIDWNAASGVGTPRRAPGGELRFSFSANPATPGRAYYLQGSAIYQYDVDSGNGSRLADFGGQRFTWFQQDADDEWFVMMRGDGSETLAWNRLTGQTHLVETSQLDGSLDDIRIDRDGRWLFLMANQDQPSGGSGTDLVVVDLESGELSDPRVRSTHAAGVRGFLIAHNPDLSDQEDFYFDPAVQERTYTSLLTDRMDGHYSGQWVHKNAPGTLQWALFSGWSGQPGRHVFNSLAVFRVDGSDLRFLAHHGSTGQEYWAQPHATISPDGHVVIWGSDMGGSDRIDTFLALLPTSEP